MVTTSGSALRLQPLGGGLMDEPYEVETGDARIAYRVAGDGEVTVLAIQPFWSDMDDVLADEHGLIAHLARTCRVIIHDRRGCGASERRPARITIDALVKDLSSVLTDAGADTAVVLGMGESGPLAVHFATQQPDRVERLVLVDPLLRPLNGQGSSMLIHTLRGKPRAGLRALARTLVSDDQAAVELGARMARTVDGPTAARLYETFMSADAATILESVTVPTLLAYGVLDRLVSETEARSLQGKIPNARLGFVAGPAAGDGALREGLIQIRDFLAEDHDRAPRPLRPRPAPAPPRAEPDGEAPVARPRKSRGSASPRKLVDYVPAGRPAAPIAYTPSTPAPRSIRATQDSPRPVAMPWGPPVDVPAEAVALNRKGVDQILLGQIEDAIESFRLAIEIAPDYVDAAVNHRELLTRLVQRRVNEWQTRQGEEAVASSERRAEQRAKRAARSRRRTLDRLLGKSA